MVKWLRRRMACRVVPTEASAQVGEATRRHQERERHRRPVRDVTRRLFSVCGERFGDHIFVDVQVGSVLLSLVARRPRVGYHTLLRRRLTRVP